MVALSRAKEVTMTPQFVSVGDVTSFTPNAAPTDVTAAVQASAPNASPRMLTRFDDAAGGLPQFAAVASVCTHRGCPVLTGDGVWGTADKPIYDQATRVVTCPCHGSQFRVDTGAVVQGPARVALATYAVQVVGGYVQVSVEPAAP
jgi:Rieske Fe-S protein